jgi:hypothetical protein
MTSPFQPASFLFLFLFLSLSLSLSLSQNSKTTSFLFIYFFLHATPCSMGTLPQNPLLPVSCKQPPSQTFLTMSTACLHVVTYPYPTMGNIIPLLDLTQQLLTRDLTVTVCSPQKTSLYLTRTSPPTHLLSTTWPSPPLISCLPYKRGMSLACAPCDQC